MKFSERYGYKPVKETLQIDSIDKELLNTLWNLLTEYYWNEIAHINYAHSLEDYLLKLIWKDFLKEQIDGMSPIGRRACLIANLLIIETQ